ncbi:MAG: hypothetical protein ACFFF4_02795 [Candidatus Thorarchaeota archaeon]
MNRVAPLAILSIIAFLLSTGFGWAAATGNGTVIVEHLTVDTPYVSGCCALIDDPLMTLPFTLYRPAVSSTSDYPVVITLQKLGESPENLAALNIELARRNMVVISISLPEEMDFSNVTWKGRQLGDVMAYLRDIYSNIAYDYAVIADATSASIAFSMNFLSIHPSAIVTIGYDSEWDQAARIYDGNLLLVSTPENLEVLNVVEERNNLTCACIGQDYGNLSLGNASGSLILQSTQVNLSDYEVIDTSVDWVLRTLHSYDFADEGLDTIENISNSIVTEGVVSDVLLGSGFLLGVVAIVEFRKRQH